VFAARALKSAIFGTPAPPDDDTMYLNDDGEESSSEIVAANETKRFQCESLSPTKPQGILLTPGTATVRRKTVSFGNEVKDKDDGKGRDDGGVPLDWGSQMGDAPKRKRKTTLTQTLENSRSGKSPNTGSRTIVPQSEKQPSTKPKPESTEKNYSGQPIRWTKLSCIKNDIEESKQVTAKQPGSHARVDCAQWTRRRCYSGFEYA